MAIDEFKDIKALPTRFNLSEEYPHAFRTIFAESFWFLLAELIAVCGYLYSLTLDTPLDEAGLPLQNASEAVLYYIMLLTTIGLICKLIYEFLYWLTYTAIIEVEHLTISSGLFFRTRASFPIAKVNDVALKRDLIDLMFGLYTVDILTASPELNYGEIYGLSKKNAIDLQTFLLTLVETTLPDVKERAALEVIEGNYEDSQIDRVIHRH